MQLGFYFDQTRCIGCYTCVVACKDWHDIPAGPVNLIDVSCQEQGVFPAVSVSYLMRACYHCENPPCAQACPTEAIVKIPDNGIVTVDSAACLGVQQCGLCKDACPYGAPQFGTDTDAPMQKCDLCLDRLNQGTKPICVEACLMRALDVGPLNELREKYGDAQEAVAFVYRSDIRPSLVVKGKAGKQREPFH